MVPSSSIMYRPVMSPSSLLASKMAGFWKTKVAAPTERKAGASATGGLGGAGRGGAGQRRQCWRPVQHSCAAPGALSEKQCLSTIPVADLTRAAGAVPAAGELNIRDGGLLDALDELHAAAGHTRHLRRCGAHPLWPQTGPGAGEGRRRLGTCSQRWRITQRVRSLRGRPAAHALMSGVSALWAPQSWAAPVALAHLLLAALRMGC